MPTHAASAVFEPWLFPVQWRELLLSYVHLLYAEPIYSINLRSPLASGQTCYRDSIGKPQCRPQNPTCPSSDLVVCSGENFCCRAPILFILNWPALFNLFSFPASQYTCYRDPADTPRCRSPATADPPTVGNTNIPNAATALIDAGATPTVAPGGNSGVPGAGGTEISSPPTIGALVNPSGTASTPVGTIVGSVLGSIAGAGILAAAVYFWLIKKSGGGQAQRQGPFGAPESDGWSSFV